MAATTTALDPSRIGGVIDLIALDYYHSASPGQRREIAQRTSGLSVRSRARDTPSFAAELGAGFPPFFPALSEQDSMFTLLTALAYGLNGFNAYMAVERDRWIGSPIDANGEVREFAHAWSLLLAALERVHFSELERTADVHIVVPRCQDRLARVCHAFGPLSAAALHVAGAGAAEACFEDPLDLGHPVVIEAEQFLCRVEKELERARIPHAVVGADLLGTSLDTASWVILCCPGGLDPELVEQVDAAWERGSALSVGPFGPERDHRWQPLPRPPPREPTSAPVPARLGLEPEDVVRAVAQARQDLNLRALATTPDEVYSTLHRDASGRPAVLFLINPGPETVEATVTAVGTRSAVDALNGEHFVAHLGAFRLEIAGRSVRMLELLPRD